MITVTVTVDTNSQLKLTWLDQQCHSSVQLHAVLLLVTDFGMDVEDEDEEAVKEEDTDVYGTFEYMSPECYKRDYGVPCFASDVFSFGVILWELRARNLTAPGYRSFGDTTAAVHVLVCGALVVVGGEGLTRFPRGKYLQSDIRVVSSRVIEVPHICERLSPSIACLAQVSKSRRLGLQCVGWN